MRASRNDPCPCGSGRKYKRCCGAATATAASPQRRLVATATQEAAALNDFGLSHLHSHRLLEAERCFERALALDPTLSVAQYNLALSLDRQGRDDAAIAAYRRVVTSNPALADAHERLGNLLHAQGRHTQALDCFRCVAALVPNSTLGRLNRAKVLHEEGKSEQAIACLRHAIALDPASSEAHRFLGNILRELGHFDEAIPCLERALALAPRESAAYHDLVQGKRVGEADRPLIARMLSLVGEYSFADRYRAHMHFALGKAFDDLGEYEQAIRHFDEANHITNLGGGFDRVQFAVGIDRLIASFTPDYFRARQAMGADCEMPVLILGMMRSGTTLVEQILSSHPEVAAGGELMFWHRRAEAYAQAGGDGPTPSYLAKVAADYQELLRRLGPHAARVTDKMPENFLWIGLIHAIFPKAYIIHCRRHPVDTCLSIYFTNFNWRKGFAYNRADIVFYYRHYARLMAHWRQVLPPDRFIEVEYEELIADRETVTRRLVARIGLDWHQACLRPQDNPLPVKTASQWQVRQPIYATSIERWRHYNAWLGELRALLPADDERAAR